MTKIRQAHVAILTLTALCQALSTVAAPPAKTGLADNTEKFLVCVDKCKTQGEKLECGENGWWYLNSCHRECEGGKPASGGKDRCMPYDKKEYATYWKCQNKCKGKVNNLECGEDRRWYENPCKRDCHGVSLASDKKICDKKDTKDLECKDKCQEEGYEADCGEDGQYYENACHRECLGVGAGKVGEECRNRMALDNYWICQERCQTKPKKDECGKGGFWYYNKCHMECYGDAPGEAGKDCP